MKARQNHESRRSRPNMILSGSDSVSSFFAVMPSSALFVVLVLFDCLVRFSVAGLLRLSITRRRAEKVLHFTLDTFSDFS